MDSSASPNAPEPLSSRRAAFSLPPDLHYLNCAYMSPLPRAAEAAGIRGIRRKRDPTRIGAEDFFRESDEVRQLFGALVGAKDPRRVALLPSASYGLAVAARNTRVEAGSNLVLLHEQFPGNVYIWRRVARESGGEVRTVRPPAGAGRGRGWNRRILEAIDSRTAVVALAPVHWTDGTLFDLELIGERAREVGAALVVDGTQWVGAAPFDVTTLRPDALVVAAYKWLLGPYSLALAYFGPRYDQGMPLEETWIAREGSEEFSGLVDYREEYKPGAVRYDVGERSNFILLPMLASALRLLLEWGPERIQAYCSRLVGPLVEDARELGFPVEEEAFRAAHLFGLGMPPGVAAAEVRTALRARSVSLSVRGSALRVSPNVYNEPRDLSALLDALREARG